MDDTVDEAPLREAVAALADDVRERNGCGGPAVRWADVRPLPPAGDGGRDEDGMPVTCRWFKAAYLGSGDWKPQEKGARGGTPPWARSCSLSLEGAPAPAGGEKLLAVSSASWWGVAVGEVRTEYGAELAAAGRSRPPKARRVFELAAWAQATCRQGTTLHRVSVSGEGRDTLPSRVDTLLDRYLDASPDCHDIKILGKVWK